MPEAVETLNFEGARDELIQSVAALERGGTTLEAAIATWERGELLAARCQTLLDGARLRLDAARGSNDASP